MAELKFENLFRVDVTEHEAGWGQRPCPEDTKFFDDEQEAIAYAKSKTEYGNNYSWIANVTRIV